MLPDKSDYDTVYINTRDTLCKHTGLSHGGGGGGGGVNLARAELGQIFQETWRRFQVTTHEHFPHFHHIRL